MVKKENLEKLLQLLPALLESKENEWFKADVISLLDKMKVAKGTGTATPVVTTLHAYSESDKEYLIINPLVFLIDYDGIPDEKVRIQLKIDCFEMARHRLGRVNHIHDFDEFCRYAHLQIEELINYFYEKKFLGNLSQIKTDISSHNSNASAKIGSASSLGQIGFIYKAWALKSKLSINSEVHNIILRVCYLRNELSHRTSLSHVSSNMKLEQYQKINGMIDDVTQVKDDGIKTILFRNGKNWDGVYHTIEYLKKKRECSEFCVR